MMNLAWTLHLSTAETGSAPPEKTIQVVPTMVVGWEHLANTYSEQTQEKQFPQQTGDEGGEITISTPWSDLSILKKTWGHAGAWLSHLVLLCHAKGTDYIQLLSKCDLKVVIL